MHFSPLPDIKSSVDPKMILYRGNWITGNMLHLLADNTLRATQTAKNKLEINMNTKNRHKGQEMETDLGQITMYLSYDEATFDEYISG